MNINELKLSNFRNISEANLKFAEQGHLIIGDNGQGKTNLLEAIHFLTVFRSFRHAADRECIRFGKDFFWLSALWTRGDDVPEKITVGFNGRRKKVTLSGNLAKNLSMVFGKFKSVLLSPDDISIIQQGPAVRRKYLDIALSIVSPNYLVRLKRYRKALAARNYLLKSRKLNVELIRPWEEQMAEDGAWLILERIEYVKLLSPLYHRWYEKLSPAENSIVSYRCRLLERKSRQVKNSQEHSRIRELLGDDLARNREVERSRGATLIGPQTDDLNFEINGRRLRNYGSQGQQRTAVICLKMAEAGLLKRHHSINAVLLLDDIFAELDRKRCERLLERLVNRHQSFITAPGKEAIFDSLSYLTVKYITGGVITDG